MGIKKWIGVLAALTIMPAAASAASDTLDGKALYEANCALCHGKTGEVSDYGKTLKPFPARNHRAIAKLVSRDELRRIITYGVEGTAMNPKKYTLDALQIEAVIDYIQTFDYTPNLANGKARFEAVCSTCHGMDGRAVTGIGAKNLVYTNLNLTEIVHTMRYGRPGTLMTSKRHQLNNTDIADIAYYVNSLRYMSNPANGKALYASNCASCHSSPRSIKLIGNAAETRSISDLSDRLLDLRIRHGRHIDRAGKKVEAISSDDMQDIIAYMRKEAQ
ncbi:c-type cytochrome [Mariprofundus erugo]|uniref:C-type cytochrome n=1 Tax=Mariprofundus erugo TaxID=2528639 RepID=A0A5R9GRP9_9PROT|nr:cytochrome c [Mariprofundus erugo]TLS67589.1 c-type cytochrome [Mariprofundus erugo]TLS74816.1 c-type cytochrome [Mariprofundus erugo]